MRSGGWMKQGSSWYYLRLRGDADGLAEQGRLLVLAGPDSGRWPRAGEKASDGKWYYFEGSGAMQSSRWLKQGTAWYYLSGSGAANRLVAHGRSLVLDGSRIRHDGNGLARERRVMVLS
ncbi:MAG: hypothetical protein ACLTMP_11265 [Eggerthella lenta]